MPFGLNQRRNADPAIAACRAARFDPDVKFLVERQIEEITRRAIDSIEHFGGYPMAGHHQEANGLARGPDLPGDC